MRRAVIVALGWGLLAATPARADVLVLDDGSRIEGRVVAEGARVVLEFDGGTVSFDAGDVARIERSATPFHELDRNVQRLGSGDVAGRRRLARWASARGLSGIAAGLFREILALVPGDREARRALGYRRLNGRWVTEAVYMRANGRVRYAGRWVDQAEAEVAGRDQHERVEERRAWQRERDARRQRRVGSPGADPPSAGWWPVEVLPEGCAPFYPERPEAPEGPNDPDASDLTFVFPVWPPACTMFGDALPL